MTDKDKADTFLEDVEALLSDYKLLAHPDPPIRPDDPEITAIAKELWPHVQKCGLTKYNCSSAPPPKTYKEWYEMVYREDSPVYQAAMEHVAGAGKRIMELLVCVRGPLCRLSELCEPYSSRKLGATKTFETYRLAAEKPTPSRLERVIRDLELIRAKVRRREEENGRHASSSGGQRGEEEEKPATHSGDFTYVKWFGQEYLFKPGQQAETVEYLWEMWENKTPDVHQKTIGSKIVSDATIFRLQHVFRTKGNKHPALGKMICSVRPGVYRLAEPEAM